MPITIDGNGTIGGASTLSTTVASPTFTTPNINSAQFASVSGTAPLYAARAWVNFDGTGTVAIRASGNVSSITDLGVGTYQANFVNAMPNANYAVNINGGNFPTAVNTLVQSTNNSSTSCTLYTYASGGAVDLNQVFAAVFR